VAQLVRTLDGLCTHCAATRETSIKSGFVDRMLRIIQSQFNIRAPLLSACLNALTAILETADQLLLKKITYGLGGVAPLMQYISGRKYEQLAETCGEVDENGVVPLKLLRNSEMMNAIGSVVAIVKVYCVRANEGDADAMDCCNKLDAAGREEQLFSALEVPDDDLKVLVMECLLEVPISNLQAEEVQNIVNIVANCDNLSVGRTEEILGHTFSIMRRLVLDDGEQGAHYRRFQGATIHMALDILVRNSGRDTRGQRQETEEKNALSVACVSFLRASSFDWPDATDLMQTRDAVEAMMQVMKSEEMYGRADLPVWVERTAVGSSMNALLQCLQELSIEGDIACRVLTRMAEVLEGRHTDEEIAEADVTKVRDLKEETADGAKRRIAQHALFVQLDGPGELLRYLLLHITVSPTAYAPSGAGVRVLHWAAEQQHEKELEMTGTDEKLMDLPDIKLEGYEYLFTPELHQISEFFKRKDGSSDLPKANADMESEGAKEGQVVASAFRVLLALLRYGTATTKRAVLEQLRDQELLRSLICLGAEITAERWIPANVGTNLLLILRDLCLLPLEQLEEEPAMLVLYDMATVMLRSCMRLLEPKLQLAIDAGPLHGGTVRPLSHPEEMLYQQVAVVYQTIAAGLSAVTLAEDATVDGAARELSLQLLIPVGHVQSLIKYLYYDTLLSYGAWSAHDEEAATMRARTVSAITRMLVDHLCGNEDTRWDLLELFARYETEHRLALRPSYQQTLLELVKRRMYEEALEPHLSARKIFPEPERVLVASWVRLEPLGKRRLLVVCNRAYYLLKPALGKRCTACDPHKFCPAGPNLVQRLAYRDVVGLSLGFGAGQRGRILWARHRVTLEKPAKAITFSVLQLGFADTVLQYVRELYPLPRPPPIEADASTPRVVRETKLLMPESERVVDYILLDRLDLGRGKAVPRAAVLSTTTLYLFIENPEYFLVDPLITAKEKRSNRKDGTKLLNEDEKFRWEQLLEADFVAGDQPIVALRFASGNVQLRFGCDFGLALFKRHLRALLPQGIDAWRRAFGDAMPHERAKETTGAGEAEAEGEEEEGEDEGEEEELEEEEEGG
jgi:hypothetical protein